MLFSSSSCIRGVPDKITLLILLLLKVGCLLTTEILRYSGSPPHETNLLKVDFENTDIPGRVLCGPAFAEEYAVNMHCLASSGCKIAADNATRTYPEVS